MSLHRPRPSLLAPCLLALALVAPTALRATSPVVPVAPRVPQQVSNVAWAGDMKAFAEADARQRPPQGGFVFVGSSSIRMWESLAKDFPGKPVINRGFGGSEVRDSTWYADQVVVPYAPCKVFLYAGDNDLNSGRSPAQVRDDVVAFVQRVHRDLPKTEVAYLSIKPSPSRANLLPAVREANGLIRDALARLPRASYIDIYTPMVDANDQPRPELFLEDQLHMTHAGYALWREAVAPQVACPKK